MDSLQIEAKIKRQLELEDQSVQEGVKSYREYRMKKERNGDGSELPPAIRILSRMMEPMMYAITEFKESRRAAGHLQTVRQLIKDVTVPELAYITIRTVLDGVCSVQPLQRVAVKVGRSVEDFIEYTRFKEVHPGFVHYLELGFAEKGTTNSRKRTVIMLKKRELGVEDIDWTEREAFDVGLKLIDMLITTTGIARKEYTSRGAEQRIVLLVPTEETEEFLRSGHSMCELLKPMWYPMVVPPLEWEDITGGGFLSCPTPRRSRLVNSRIPEHRKQDVERLDEVFAAINTLQRTAWRINTKVLEILREVWLNSDGLGVLPNTTPPELRLPPKPWSDDDDFDRMNSGPLKKLVSEWKFQAQTVYGEYHREKAKRFSIAKKISIAEKLSDEEALYFVYFLDWRGRIYPKQQFINPQSDDPGSALLEFAHGKPLGPTGAKWLAIHTANTFGFDKASRNDRIKWVRENEELIRACAKDPLGDGRLWLDADSPFCFLAACFAWDGYCEQGEDYVCHLPIQVDGSCNGLQHFAMLLGDAVGGSAVNVCPPNTWDDKPADVYARVAEVVELRLLELCTSAEVFMTRKQSTGKEVKHTKGMLAKALSGRVTRTVVKRNVMTTPYGATKRGMSHQNMKVLRELGTTEGNYVDYPDQLVVGMFLTEMVYEAIGEVVIAARETMNWFHEVADCYNKANEPIVWDTPTGFRVTQRYRKSRLQRIKSVFGGTRIDLGLKVDTQSLDKAKQKSGIAPNFIHSLDSSHLVRTVNSCAKAGIVDHSMIHDSFGSHACDMDEYSRILREEAVKLYEGKDYLKEFELLTREKLGKFAEKLRPSPKKGSLNISDVLENCCFFT